MQSPNHISYCLTDCLSYHLAGDRFSYHFQTCYMSYSLREARCEIASSLKQRNERWRWRFNGVVGSGGSSIPPSYSCELPYDKIPVETSCHDLAFLGDGEILRHTMILTQLGLQTDRQHKLRHVL